ncbi:energy-coupling factor ABC transporter ATP-binding protein [Orrella sp. 11846]|uniref:energy-coupling factor ABC transporter ATP-binding protein n=1 Tax=Orrella sp. 11846 TaxID=3409913 RepID=UPI003B5C2A86
MLVEFEGVRLERGEQCILRDVSLRLSESRIGIVGPNGAGKSSFARLLNGLLKPQRGRVLFQGVDVQSDLRKIRKQIGFLFQNPDNQLVFPIVREDMDFGLKAHIPDKTLRQTRIDETLARLGIDQLADRVVHTLSGGQKQLVALATVLSVEPAMLVLDEPTTQLDLRYRNRLVALLQTITQPAIVLTHDLPMLETFDRVLVIADGGVVRDGPPADVLTWYQQHYG